MRARSFLLVFSLVVSTTLLASYWVFHYRENINEVWQNLLRRRRSSDNETKTGTPASAASQWVSQMMQMRLDKSQIREEENVLATALAKLLITSPEDIMKYMTEESFGCKKINHSLNTFQRNFHGDLAGNNTYVKLFQSLSKFYSLICGPNEMYRKLFTPLQEEMGKLHEQFAFCAGELDWYERNGTVACTEGQRILDCYHSSLVYDIGEMAAFHYDSIFRHVINSSLAQPCKFKKLSMALKDASSRSSNINVNYYLLALALMSWIIL